MAGNPWRDFWSGDRYSDGSGCWTGMLGLMAVAGLVWFVLWLIGVLT